jgi:sphingomyelin phosphodiesterase
LLESFGNWLNEEEKASFTENGCYMVKVAKNLRLLSLNTVFGDDENFYMYLNQTDPDGTMTWLSNQLADAEKAKDKVQIVAHVPGGANTFEAWSLNYYKLVNR